MPALLAEVTQRVLQTTSGGLIMSTSGTKQMHDATIGTVLAVGSEVKVCALPHWGVPLTWWRFQTSKRLLPTASVHVNCPVTRRDQSQFRIAGFRLWKFLMTVAITILFHGIVVMDRVKITPPCAISVWLCLVFPPSSRSPLRYAHLSECRAVTVGGVGGAQISVAKDDTVLFTKQGSSDVPVGRDGEVCFVQERAVLAKLS